MLLAMVALIAHVICQRSGRRRLIRFRLFATNETASILGRFAMTTPPD